MKASRRSASRSLMKPAARRARAAQPPAAVFRDFVRQLERLSAPRGPRPEGSR